MDGDGALDLRIMEWPDPNEVSGTLTLWTVSTATMKPVRRTDLAPSVARYARGIWCGVDDIDQDGTEDFVLNAPKGGESSSCPVAISGATGEPIPEWGKALHRPNIRSIIRASDVDDDGFDDLFVASSVRGKTLSESIVMLMVISGRSGEILAQRTQRIADEIGIRVLRTQDIDGDGNSDLMLLGQQNAPQAGGPGEGSLHSGLDLKPICEIKQHEPGRFFYGVFAIDACALGDVNGDGVPDRAISACNRQGSGWGRVEVYSGKDGAFLKLFTRASLDAK